MQRVIIYQDQEKLDKFYQQLQETENALQGIVNRFKLTTGHCPNLPEIRAMFDTEGRFDPERLKDVIMGRMYPGKEIEVHGVMVSRAKLREIVTLPDLADLAETLKFIADNIGIEFINFFQIDENSAQVKQIGDRINSHADNFKIYASGSGELERLDQARQVAGIFTNIVKEYQIDPARLEIPGFVINTKYGGFAAEVDFVKHSKLK